MTWGLDEFSVSASAVLSTRAAIRQWLGSEARMNTPSTLGSNWKWRTLPGTYHEALAHKLYEDMRVYQRLNRN